MSQLNNKELENEEREQEARENWEPEDMVISVNDTLNFLAFILAPGLYAGYYVAYYLAYWICTVKDKLGGWSPIISALGILTVVGVYRGFPKVRPFMIGLLLFILLIWWMLWFAKRQTPKMKK
ncbi:MAG: hypothetical protein J6J31_00435 [Thermoguttaceae bacterium]|nr:hypothetical protein [Thermoguttaceae bacterium]